MIPSSWARKASGTRPSYLPSFRNLIIRLIFCFSIFLNRFLRQQYQITASGSRIYQYLTFVTEKDVTNDRIRSPRLQDNCKECVDTVAFRQVCQRPPTDKYNHRLKPISSSISSICPDTYALCPILLPLKPPHRPQHQRLRKSFVFLNITRFFPMIERLYCNGGVCFVFKVCALGTEFR